MITLVHMTTVPESLGFLAGQVGYMKSRGFEIHAISTGGERLEEFGSTENVRVHAVNMQRRIAPFEDIVALWRLCFTLRQIRPQIVHAHTPKAGLLGMIAAFLARIPIRVYHVHGLPLMTASGYKRVVLRLSELVSCRLAHEVFCVSDSIRQVMIDQNLCPADKIKVFLNGSINGVDAKGRFNPERLGSEAKTVARCRFGIPLHALVVGFVGRIVRDKGLVELVEAWKNLRNNFPELHLLVVGDFEPQDPVPDETKKVLQNDPRIHLAGFVADTPMMYTAMDVVVLPSYREGFPVVPLEAAAMGIPVVATDIPGCRDAVQNGVTGILVPVRDSLALAQAIRSYLIDPFMRQRHGQAARARVLSDFRQEPIWKAVYQEYLHLLH